MDFAKIAPFLTNPLVLIGFSLFIFLGSVKLIIKAGVIPKVTKEAGSGIIRDLLDYSFYLAFLVILLGFTLEGWKIYIHDGRMAKENIAIEADSRQNMNEPTVNIIDTITDESGNQINNREAPFKIRVRGVVLNSKLFYTYLIVDDGNAQWIEPPASNLGPNVNGEFSAYCYLGVIYSADSLNKLYKVFAVVTNREYKEYDKLDRSTIKAQSNYVELRRTR